MVDLPLNSTFRKYLSKSAPLVGFMASQSDGRPPHKSRCMSLWGLAQLKRAFFGYECHTLRVHACVCVRVVSLPQGVGKRHYRIANELKLILKIGILARESLLGGAVATVVVVRCTGAARITALEMVFPELCNDRRRSMLSPNRGGSEEWRHRRQITYPQTRDCVDCSPRLG